MFDSRGAIVLPQGVDAFRGTQTLSSTARGRQLTTTSEEDVKRDRDRARQALQRAKLEAEQRAREVDVFEALLALASAPDTVASDAAGLTLHEAMATVLRDAPQHMLRAGDLAAEVDRRHLYRMRDGRPVEAQQIHARVGHYGHLFVREGTFIKLVDQA